MWLLPSRSRIPNLHRFFDAFRNTGASTAGAILLNYGDWRANEAAYRKIRLPHNWWIETFAEDTLGGKLNAWWRARGSSLPRYAPIGRQAWIGYLQDDLVPETWRWDRELVHSVTFGGHDLITASGGGEWPAEKLNGAIVWSSRLLEATGWIFPPPLPHIYADDAWEDLCRCLPLRMHRGDVVLHHLHPLKGGAATDPTYQSIYAQQRWTEAEIAYSEWRALHHAETVERIQRALYGAPQ